MLLDHFEVNSHLILDYSILYACIELWDSQPTSLKNFRFHWKIWQLHSELKKFGDVNLHLDKHTVVTISFDDILSYRPIHKIDIDAFKVDILKSDLIRDPRGHLSDLCKQNYHVFKALLNKHTPIITKSVSKKPPAQWMTPEILLSKRHCRYLERVWHKSCSPLDRLCYSKQCHYCNTNG